jgi:hypothetical protein
MDGRMDWDEGGGGGGMKTHILPPTQSFLVALQVLPLLFDFTIESALVLQQRLYLLFSALQLAGYSADGARDVVLDVLEVRVACQRALPRNSKLLLRAQEFMQGRASLRELAGYLADRSHFA